MLSEVVEWEVRLRPRKEGSMSILIRDMAIPKNCGECPCYYDGYCHGMQYREEDEDYRAVSYREYDKKRRDNCPLIELPPHGDLIDADEFYKDINESILLTDGFKDAFNLWFDEQPTIIESEGEND